MQGLAQITTQMATSQLHTLGGLLIERERVEKIIGSKHKGSRDTTIYTWSPSSIMLIASCTNYYTSCSTPSSIMLIACCTNYSRASAHPQASRSQPVSCSAPRTAPRNVSTQGNTATSRTAARKRRSKKTRLEKILFG